MAEVIHVEPHDNVAALRERLAASSEEQALLVAVDGVPWLRDLVHLKLLRREAQNLAMDVALVTRDSATQVLAKEAGLAVFSSVKAGEKKTGWRVKRLDEEERARRAAQKPVEPKAPSLPQRGRATRWGRVLLGILLVIVFIGALGAGVAFLVVPSATITVVPATQPVEGTLEVIADTEVDEIDADDLQVPAQIVDILISGMAEAPTLVREDVPEGRSTGTVTLINKRDEPATIPEGTIVSTSAGSNIRFRTIEEVELEARSGASQRVGIVALEPGLRGNVDAFTINQIGPNYSFMVNVINEEPTSGGNVRRKGVATEEDRSRLRSSLVQRLEQEARTRLQETVGEETFVAPDSIETEVMDESFENVGEENEVLRLTLRLHAQGIAVSETDAAAVAEAWLSRQVSSDFRVLPNSVSVERESSAQVEKEQVRFTLRAAATAKARINAGQVETALRGMKVEAARDYLQSRWELAAPPVVQVMPEWVGRVPWLSFRTRVTVAEGE